MNGHFGLCLRRILSGKSRDYHVVIVFAKRRFQNVSRPHENAKPAFSNSSSLKSVFEKLCFRDGLLWTVDLALEIKLRFRDGLLWTVGLTVEIKLRFQISPGLCERGLKLLAHLLY